MKARNAILTLAALALFAAIGIFSTTTRAGAIASTTESFSRNFGMVGITQGQTARLNLVNLEPGEFVPCVKVELSFIDGAGNTLMQKVYDIDRGKSAFLDLNGNQFVARGGRTQIRAQVRFVGTPDTVDNPDLRNCPPTLEMIDNATGRTSFIVPLRDDPFFQPAK
ncbi:MAG: hypothetical protein ABI977_10840 [Acidobacteriota bacterium]